MRAEVRRAAESEEGNNERTGSRPSCQTSAGDYPRKARLSHEYLSGRQGRKEPVIGKESEASGDLILDTVWKHVGFSDNEYGYEQNGYLPRTSSHFFPCRHKDVRDGMSRDQPISCTQTHNQE